MILNGLIMVPLQSSIILTDILSGPLDFPEFRFLSMQAMSLLVICMLSSLAVVLNTKLGRVLKLMGLHWVAKKLLNDVALSLQLTIHMLYISSRGRGYS